MTPIPPVRSVVVPASAPGYLRWGIGVLLGIGILINYFDRINLSIAAPALSKEFHLGPLQPGLLFGVFFWSYSLLHGATSSFGNAFIAAGIVLIIGIVCYVFLLGRIEPIPEPGS